MATPNVGRFAGCLRAMVSSRWRARAKFYLLKNSCLFAALHYLATHKRFMNPNMQFVLLQVLQW